MHHRLDFIYRFHPVGQGLFCSGTVLDPTESRDLFHWVFDCGSMHRKTTWQYQVSGYRDVTLHGGFLGLLCVSHFDKDHVSGLGELIKGVHIDTVVIPYFTPVERLVLASLQEEMGPGAAGDSEDYASFLSNPAGFILERAGSVRQFVFVRSEDDGGPEGDWWLDYGPDSPLRDLTDRIVKVPKKEPFKSDSRWNTIVMDQEKGKPLPNKAKFVEFLKDCIPGFPGIVEAVPGNGSLRCVNGASTTLAAWEFLFHCKSECQRTVRGLIADIERTLSALRAPASASCGPLQQALQDKVTLSAIKRSYQRAFPGGKRFNAAGLCLYAGPVMENQCEMLGTGVSYSFCDSIPFVRTVAQDIFPMSHAGFLKPSILYTGDGDFSVQSNRRDLKNFLSDLRWAKIGIMQVPHHGACTSWERGSSVEFSHEISVFCADPEYEHHHPDHAVLLDLLRHSPVLVDRKLGAVMYGAAFFREPTVINETLDDESGDRILL